MKKFLLWLNIFCALGLLLAYLATMTSPLSFRLLPLFGLSYIFWFILNILFLIFWLFVRKRKVALISFFVLLLGWNIHGSNYRLSIFSSDSSSEDDLKVMTYNVRSFDRYEFLDGIETRNEIFDLIKEEESDVLCFQEFYYSTMSGDFNTRDTLLEINNTKYYHEKYTHHMRGGRHFGVCTISKYPILKKGEIAFENDENNFCIYSDILIEGDTTRVFNAHLASIRFEKKDYEFMDQENAQNKESDFKNDAKRIVSRLLLAYKKRASQTDKVLQEIKNSPHPVILCGDFNDVPVSYCYRQFLSELDDSFKESGRGLSSTYIGRFPSFRIDYVFHSSEYESTSYKTVNKQLSDHKPIIVTLKKD